MSGRVLVAKIIQLKEIIIDYIQKLEAAGRSICHK